MSNPFDNITIPDDNSGSNGSSEEKEKVVVTTENKPEEESEKKTETPEEGEEGNPEDISEAEAEKQYIETIAKLAGIETKENYNLTAEGISNMIKETQLNKVDEFRNDIKQHYPQAWDLLEYLDSGGSFEEFVDKYKMAKEYGANGIDPNNELLHEQIVKNWYIQNSKMTPDVAAMMVGALKGNKQLYDEAKRIEQLTAEQRLIEQRQLLENQKKERAEIEAKATQDWNSILKAIDNGNLGSFVIPETEKGEFANFLHSNLKFDNSSKAFYLTLPINSGDMKTLASSFFAYKKGDLSSFIDSRAATKRVIDLKKKSDGGFSGNPNSGNTKDDISPFARLFKTLKQ